MSLQFRDKDDMQDSVNFFAQIQVEETFIHADLSLWHLTPSSKNLFCIYELPLPYFYQVKAVRFSHWLSAEVQFSNTTCIWEVPTLQNMLLFILFFHLFNQLIVYLQSQTVWIIFFSQ